MSCTFWNLRRKQRMLQQENAAGAPEQKWSKKKPEQKAVGKRADKRTA